MQQLGESTLWELQRRDKFVKWCLGGILWGITYDWLFRKLGQTIQFCVSGLDKKKRFTEIWFFLQTEILTLANLITFYGLFGLGNFIFFALSLASSVYSVNTAIWGMERSFLNICFWQLLEIFASDFIDGPLARLNGRVSALGTFLDHFRDYLSALVALVLLVTVTASENDWYTVLYELGALLGLSGILWYYLRIFFLKYKTMEPGVTKSWHLFVKNRIALFKDFALNEYQTEISGRIQFFVIAFTICAGIYYYDQKKFVIGLIFHGSMAANLVWTGIYIAVTYNVYERVYVLIQEKSEKIKQKIADKKLEFREKAAERKEINGWLWWLPSTLSVIRLLAFIPIAFALYFDWKFLALYIFLAAAITDFLDGLTARWLKQESWLGKVLDRSADKSLYLFTLYFLWKIQNSAPASVIFWFTVIPEVALLTTCFTTLGGIFKLDPKATWVGKVKTFFFHFPTGVLLLYGHIIDSSEWLMAGLFLGFLGVGWSAASLISHLNVPRSKSP